MFTKNSFILHCLRLIFIISGVCFTIIASMWGSNEEVLFSVFCAFVIFVVAVYGFKLFDKMIENFNPLLFVACFFLAVTASAYIVNITYWARYIEVGEILKQFDVSKKMLIDVGAQLYEYIRYGSTFALTVFIYFILNSVYKTINPILKSFGKFEWLVLIVMSVTVVTTICVIFDHTRVFYEPMVQKNIISYDVIYTSDTPMIFNNNSYLNINSIENDIRQPLFGIFALPFSSLAFFLSQLFKNMQLYSYLLAAVQSILIIVIGLLLADMLKLRKQNFLIFLLMYGLSFSTLLFTINMEQYVFAVFWMILFIHSYLNHEKASSTYFIGATGSMMTSGAFFILLSKQKKIYLWFRDMIYEAIKLLSMIVVCGQLPQLFKAVTSVNELLRYSGEKLSFLDKFYQFSNYVYSCFFMPLSHIDFKLYEHVSFQLNEVSAINWTGILILVGAMIGFIISREEKISRIAMYWTGLSFIILCVIGWGTAENGLVLYTFYFGWAILILWYQLFTWIEGKIKLPQGTLSIVLIIAFCVINIPGIISIVEFGMKYYPRW